MYKNIILTLSVLCTFVLVAQGQIDLNQQVPFSKDFRIGVLPNGLTYYIKHNETPKDKASFYLYQNVGAVLENDNQNGLAHFLEHMAFNGTTHFPGNTMIDWLEQKGLKFGKEINAFTSTNKTVYNISNLPVTNEKNIDSCLLILNDWCNELSLTNQEIDAERNVIQEEWRQRYNANYRLDQQLKGVKYNHSIYSNRDALGSMDVVKNFKYKALKDFYHDWYRTDLQAIGIVGDFDVDVVEEKVKTLFSKIPAIKNPKERIYIKIPDNEKPLYKVATDKEVKDITLTLQIRHFYKKDNSQEQLRESLVHGFFNILLNQRLKELQFKGKTSFSSARALYADFEKNYKVFNINFNSAEANLEKAWKQVYSEIQRVSQHGFTQNELKRVKNMMLEKNEGKANGKSKVSSVGYCKNIMEAYLDGIAIPDTQFNYEFAKNVIPTITTQELTALVDQLLTKQNRVFTFTAPEKAHLNLPSLEELQNIMVQVEGSALKPYVEDKPVNIALLDTTPKGGKIVNEKLLKGFKAVEWQLSNGATVVYKISGTKKGQLELNAVSPGGASLYKIEDLPSLQAVSLVNKYGIGDLDADTYRKAMKGNSAKSNVSVESYFEKISASASNKDIETLFQLVFMHFETPRFDKNKFDEVMRGNYSSLKNEEINPNTIIGKAYKTLAANGDPRYFEFNKTYLDQINFERSKEIYNERFSNPGDFNFYLIGDAPFKTVKSLVETYIGAITPSAGTESPVMLKNYFPKGLNKHVVKVPMQAPKSTVVIKMQKEIEYNRNQIVHHKVLADVLNMVLIENIREKEGGVYTIGVNAGDMRMPVPMLNMDISFMCDPANAPRLNDLVFAELEHIKQEVNQSDLEKVILNLKQSRPYLKRSNRYWMKTLETYYNYGENMMVPEYYDDILEKVTTEDIKKAAQNFFNSANTLDIIFLPKDE
ncbi:insulinase family protein [Aestuariibaculum sp. YM273]|uniref:M16 family metallopeptidase n=1 Tax=Aestuariibaculum sp. YM273 TaxID=3070659 RepID=UPI0027DCB46F|nr:M16 family metallopeptidase [Aestuariibaculum sp. YM273]WMI66016.1 insulinase family protein [Aestuariibaculum sp. YM273]